MIAKHPNFGPLIRKSTHIPAICRPDQTGECCSQLHGLGAHEVRHGLDASKLRFLQQQGERARA